MDHSDFVDEVSFSLRRIRLIEDWFVFLATRGHLKDEERIVAMLNDGRPSFIPMIRQLRSMNMEELHREVITLSKWAYRLMDIKDLVLKEKLVKGVFSFALHTNLSKVDHNQDVITVRRFTFGIEPLKQIFKGAPSVMSDD